MTLSTILVIALTLWGEARGESYEGKYAVAQVIVARHEQSGHSYKKVCLEPKQFSCWHNGIFTQRMPKGKEPEWVECYSIADAMVKGQVPPSRATHFRSIKVRPSWMYAMTRIERIGRHVFYEEN